MKQCEVPVQDHFPSLHSETIAHSAVSALICLSSNGQYLIVLLKFSKQDMEWYAMCHVISFRIFEDTDTDPSKIYALRKYVYSNILKILPSKNENFQIKTSDIFHISAQNIDCGYSLE